MIIDYPGILNKLINCTVPKPASGTLSGHAAGEPFDKHVYKIIKAFYPNETFRPYEYLNSLYLNNPTHLTPAQRHQLHKSRTVAFLLNRSTQATSNWTPASMFDEKQNDTADILITDCSTYEIIDVKTRNLSKKAQPPNIISAEKLVRACALMIDDQEFDKINITYLGIDWALDGEELVCKQARVAKLFKAAPESLYINWAAGLQIQFQVESLDQGFTGPIEDWCRSFIRHYVKKRKLNLTKVLKNKIEPFEKYLN